MIAHLAIGKPRQGLSRRVASSTVIGILTALGLSTVVVAQWTPASGRTHAVPVGATPVPTRPATTTSDVAVEFAGEDAPPAREHLRQLAAAITSVPTDTATGRLAYVHVKRWTADSTMLGGQSASIDTVVVDERRWRASDGSGRIITARLPDRPGRTPTSTSEDYPVGRLAEGTDPVPTDPALLASMIDSIQPWVNGPYAGLRGVNDLNAWHYLDHDQRMAALTVLVNTDGPRWRGHTTDRAGRPGVAVSYDTATSRDLLIIDQHTGELLAYALQTQSTPDDANGPDHIELYELYQDRGRTQTPH